MQPITLKPIFPSQTTTRPLCFSGISPWMVTTSDRVLSNIQKTRTREMLFEDLMGFGLLRTGMDLFRQYFFEQTTTNQRKLNIPAARERVIREVGSIITDNFSGGIFAFIIAWAANRLQKNRKNIANQFASNETLSLFQQLVEKSPTSNAFLSNMAKSLAPDKNKPALAFLNAATQTRSKKALEHYTVSLAKMINPNTQTLDIAIGKRRFPLDTLLEDTTKFLDFTQKNVSRNKTWQQQAREILSETVKINRWRLPVSLCLAMALTMAVPYLNRYITRKMDGMENYPGELGLREFSDSLNKRNKPWLEHYFPYLYESTQKGKILPLLASLIPLPFAFGLFDTVKLSNGAGFKTAFNNPFKKGFLERLASIMQFGKGFPFTTQQQMASLFAFLIFSRLTASRSDIEFRERMVDSFLGWAIWILATPRIKKYIAERWDKNLLKRVGQETVLKRRIEIEQFLPKAVKQSTLGKYIIMSAASLGITLALLGIIEPYAAIKWTEWQAKRS